MRGFTLLELIVVVALIGLLAGLAGRSIVVRDAEARREIAFAKCREYYDATWSWMMFTRASSPPETLAILRKPIREGDRPYMRLEKDPWGQYFRIERENGRNFRIWSNGPDTDAGTADDICYEPLDDA